MEKMELLINEIQLFGACMARDGAAYAGGFNPCNPIDGMKANKHYVEIMRMLKQEEVKNNG